MSIASLARFEVPVGGVESQGLLMPKLKYRFRVRFTGFGAIPGGATVLTKQVMKASRPDVSFDEIKLPVYNSTVKLPGKYTWADTQITLRDDASGQVSQIVGQQIQRQFDFYEQSSAASAGDFKFTMELDILDGGNGADNYAVLETFQFIGCYIKKAKYADGDYGNSTEPMDIVLDITYDNAIQFINGKLSGVGGIGNGAQHPGTFGLATAAR